LRLFQPTGGMSVDEVPYSAQPGHSICHGPRAYDHHTAALTGFERFVGPRSIPESYACVVGRGASSEPRRWPREEATLRFFSARVVETTNPSRKQLDISPRAKATTVGP